MSQIPDSHSSSSQGAAATSLEAGLAALKQGNYSAAIPQLESVCQTQSRGNSKPTAPVLRARMGLVVAYERTGKPEQALVLCQTLSRSTNPQVKSWAERTVNDLTRRYPHIQLTPQTNNPSASTADSTGFVPLNPTTTPSSPSVSPTAEATGFVPLNQTVNSSSPQLGLNSGITAASAQSASASAPFPESATPNPPSADTPSVDDGHNLPSAESMAIVPLLSSGLSVYESGRQWSQAGRAQQWQPLRAVQQERLWLVQVGTAFALFWVIRVLVEFVMETTNNILGNIPFLQTIPAFYNDPTGTVIITLLSLAVASPWLMDLLLKLFYRLQPLSMPTLARYSPETSRMLARFCQQRRIPLPTLRLLPISAPMAFTYGHLPRFSRIVVTQGFLDQLEDDEIATIYASQLGHLTRSKRIGLVISAVLAIIGGFFNLLNNPDWAGNCWWLAIICLPMGFDLAVISLVVLVAQLFYTVYQQVALAADSWRNPIMRSAGAIISAVSYTLFCVIRYLALWLSRIRVYYSDRSSVDITGNPNGLSRALLKMTMGIAEDVKQSGSTHWLLESLDLLAPVGHFRAISLGSLPPQTPFESVLQWDRLNPNRQWLVINNSHPLLGDRLHLLSLYANHWKLDTELDYTKEARRDQLPSQPAQNSKFLLQGAPFLGILLGLGFGCLLWLLAWIGDWFGIRQLSWILDDYWILFLGCVPMGFSIGTFVRINHFFPDIKPTNLQADPNLSDLYTPINSLPVDSHPVGFHAQLLGRRGISNCLGQDLILQTDSGLIKVHHFSQLGPIGNLWSKSSRPSSFISREVIATGWFRRGATLWIDLETLRTPDGAISRGGHPIWSTILAIAAAAWGAYIILRG